MSVAERAGTGDESSSAADVKRFDVRVSSASQRSQLSSLADPDVIAVRESLGSALVRTLDPDMVPVMVEDEPNAAYPGSVQVRSSMRKYVYLWSDDLMMWVLVCCNLTTFDVSLSTTVQVDVEVATELVRK